MSSYNLIPVTDLTAVSFTGTVSTTAFTVNTATVTGEVDAFPFRSNLQPTTIPGYTFAGNVGIFSRAIATTPTTTLGFLLANTTVMEFRTFTNAQPGGARLVFGISPGSLANTACIQQSAQSIVNFLIPTAIFSVGPRAQVPIYVEKIFAGNVNNITTEVGITDAGLNHGPGYIFKAQTDLCIRSNTTVNDANSIGSVWAQTPDQDGNAWHYNKPGLLQQATTSITPSLVRSNAHVTNLLTGIATLFVRLPSTIPGLKHTISNARAVANTVVISPQATTDTLFITGLTKATGASVAANAPFSSITFHCVTSTQWVATKQTGAWV